MRAFIGIKIQPSGQVIEKLGSLGNLEYIKPVEKENMHILLKFLGEITGEDAGKIKTALEELRGFGEFRIRLTDVSAFPDMDFIRVVVIKAESEKLMELREQLEEKLEKIGFGREKRAYAPHLTLGRVKRKPDGRINGALGKFGAEELLVKQIYLVRSLLTPEGPKYEDIQAVNL